MVPGSQQAHISEDDCGEGAAVCSLVDGMAEANERSAGDAAAAPQLTSVRVERSKHGLLLGRAGAVGDLHLQLVPGGLLQVVQDVALSEGGALGAGPSAGVHRPVLQDEGGDWTAAVVPAGQVEPGSAGVDAGEQLVLFGKLRF